MSWHNFGGLNPQYKEFMDAHPDKTIIGVFWSMYWRLMVVVLVVELFFVLCLMLVGMVFGFAAHPDNDVFLPGPGAVQSQE